MDPMDATHRSGARRPASQGPTPSGGLTVFEYTKRVRVFRKAVYALPPAQRAVFIRRWPDFEKHPDPLLWNDDKTALAERYWRDATGDPIPPALQPPRFAEIRAERSRNEALELAQAVQRREGGFTARTTIEAGKDNKGGQKRHYNDLNNGIFHDARDLLALPTAAVLFLAGHEVGHTTFYPGTRARAEFDRGLMEMYDAQMNRKWFAQKGATWGGKSTVSLFQNFLGDQIINYRFQFVGSFGENFHDGFFWMLTNEPGQRESRGASWFFKMHFRLLWASCIKYAGGYYKGGKFVRIRDVSQIPPLLTFGGRAYPQVTYHDGKEWEWLRLPNGRYRLVELWHAIHDVGPANVRKNLKRIMELSEPFFFPPKLPPDLTKDNPDGIACPRCKKPDKVRIITRGGKPDPLAPGKTIPRLECRGCFVHLDSSFTGVWEFDRDTMRNQRVMGAP